MTSRAAIRNRDHPCGDLREEQEYEHRTTAKRLEAGGGDRADSWLGFFDPGERYRVLRKNGVFVTQQVGAVEGTIHRYLIVAGK